MPSKENYKDALKRVLAMRSKAALAVYERTKLLSDVFDDADFRADLGNVDDFRAADALDKYVDDLPYTFLQLRAMIQKFPQASDWRTRSLRDLHADTIATSPADSKPEIKRHVVSKKEYEELADKVKSLEASHKFTKELLDERTKSYEEVLEENRELRRQLAVAEGRIQELEAMTRRQAVH